MLCEKVHDFPSVLYKLGCRGYSTHGNLSHLAQRVLKIAVDDFALLFVYELHQITELPAHLFEHRKGDVSPVFILLKVKDELKLLSDHRDARFFLKATGDFLYLLAEPDKRFVFIEHG